MFSKDPKKRLKQIEGALKHNKNLSESGRAKLLQMKSNLENGKTSLSKSVEKKVNQYGVEVGDVFYDSFGYDATYYNFYEVTDILGKSKIKVRKLGKKSGEGNGYGPCDWTIRPVKGNYVGEPEEKIVKKASWGKDTGDKYNLVIGGSYKGRHCYYISPEEAFNKDWHEDDYH